MSPHLSYNLAHGVAAIPQALGLLVIMAGIGHAAVADGRRHRFVRLSTAIGLGLEFFLAAGLIRLSTTRTFEALTVIVIIIGLRRLINFGLREAEKALA